MSDINLLRQSMDAELKRAVIPALRTAGFKGSFPHLRRAGQDWIDLITFQFDRHGGGFVIEIARCDLTGTITHWGKHIPPDKVRAWDLHPDRRKRLQPCDGSGRDSWFRFDEEPVDVISADVKVLLQSSETWDDVPIPSSAA
ncbi:DUF4304 domain-containing protein [Microvirga sp. CF3062]|uniref:DUF4304 domain-containing protein n=1 Tax=Microvirga sp. CF3062 TaxID=3110182 RepID=UPI002E75B6F3|nr:DUF4304 domain-containing protein [Microvirga sp. CF3062]MEE1655210.1 DUF4304 domain-containing protein [Microvirga sp. CF3062]